MASIKKPYHKQFERITQGYELYAKSIARCEDESSTDVSVFDLLQRLTRSKEQARIKPPSKLRYTMVFKR